MKIYLVQHGEAVSESVNPERPLSEKGLADVNKVASFLPSAGACVSTIRHSGKTRARQTAEILASTLLPGKGLFETKGLLPNDPVGPFVENLNKAEETLMIVGHQPFLGKLAATLVTGSEWREVVGFQQGGVLCLERLDSGVWRIAWMLVPSILR